MLGKRKRHSLLNISNINNNINNILVDKVIKIQKWFRGSIYRLKTLPLILYKIQKYLQSITFKFSNNTNDGRVNSCIDEDQIILLLLEKFNNKIIKPKIRMWYDILVYDNNYKWIPVNIKTTTTSTPDNTGNLATCIYAYTDEELDLYKCYGNGKMSELLFVKLQEKKYNKFNKKDYYFIVLNKLNPSEIIINSIKGLTRLTANINNLPFQVKWNKNKIFNYENINKKVKLFIDCLQNSKPSWAEKFMKNIRSII